MGKFVSHLKKSEKTLFFFREMWYNRDCVVICEPENGVYHYGKKEKEKP